MPEVPLEFAPSPAQQVVWGRFIMSDLGVDVDGWWMGWCPLHDKQQAASTSTAQFNFLRGVMRCEAEPSCLAPKRTSSLQNVLVRMAQGNG